MFNFEEPLVPQVSAELVKKALDINESCVLLDVRTPGEFARGKIAGAINMPVDEIVEKVNSRLTDKLATIYVYCLSGSRSVYAVEAMRQLGYKNVFNLTSGLLAWRMEKFPLVA